MAKRSKRAAELSELEFDALIEESLKSWRGKRRRLRAPVVPASNFIKPLSSLKRGQAIKLYLRVSRGEQERSGNFKGQIALCRHELRRKGIRVVCRIVHDVCSGKVLEGDGTGVDREKLIDAAADAKRLGVPLVAVSTDRFLRNVWFKTNKLHLLPTEAEFEELRRQTGGVLLVTVLPPDMPPGDVLAIRAKWGQKAKGKKGGRPELWETRRARIFKRVKYLREEWGMSIRNIARWVNVSKSAIERLLQSEEYRLSRLSSSD